MSPTSPSLGEPPSPPSPEDDARATAPRDETMTWVLGTVGAVGVLLATAAGIGWGLRPALGVGIGASLALLNLLVFTRVVRGLLGPRRYHRRWILVAVVKLVVLFGGLYLLLRSGMASGVALVLGYGALPLGITVGGLLAPRPDEGGAPPRP